MEKRSILSIVIPALNEEKSIESVAKRCLALKGNDYLQSKGLDLEVIVVDDGSTDKTALIASSLPEVRVVSHPRNLGYGAALKTGVKESRGDMVAFLDADGTNPPEFLPELVKAILDQEADIAIAARLGASSKMPSVRRAGNRIFAALLSWLTTEKITDTASGQRVFWKKSVPWFEELPDGLHLTPAMSTRALHEGLRLVEVPAPYEARSGESKLSAMADGWRFLGAILGTATRYNPLKLLGFGGTVLWSLALALSAEPVLLYIEKGTEPDWMVYRLCAIEALAVLANSMIFIGIYGNALFSVLYRRPPHKNSVWGSLVLRPGSVKIIGWVGVALAGLAVWINRDPLVNYLKTGVVWDHWLKPVAGMGFLLIGMQLILFSVLLRLLWAAAPAGADRGNRDRGDRA